MHNSLQVSLYPNSRFIYPFQFIFSSLVGSEIPFLLDLLYLYIYFFFIYLFAFRVIPRIYFLHNSVTACKSFLVEGKSQGEGERDCISRGAGKQGLEPRSSHMVTCAFYQVSHYPLLLTIHIFSGWEDLSSQVLKAKASESSLAPLPYTPHLICQAALLSLSPVQMQSLITSLHQERPLPSPDAVISS